MSWNFYTNESIEEPFVHDVGRFMNAIENPRKFNGRVAYKKGGVQSAKGRQQCWDSHLEQTPG